VGARRLLGTLYALMLNRAPIKSLLWATAFIFSATSVAMAAKTMSCESLNELACIKSPARTLVQVETNRYLCRVATGKCELGFIQWGEKQRERCESKPGCDYVPGNCYCPPDVTCPCGGGKPPQCIARAKTVVRAHNLAVYPDAREASHLDIVSAVARR